MNSSRNPLRLSAVIISVMVIALSATVSHGETESKASITGHVMCERGSFLDGMVELLMNDEVADYVYVYEDGYFEFNDVQPGTYNLAFKDLGEIPIEGSLRVEVTANRNLNVNLAIPYAFSGLPCDEMLKLGWDGYNDLIGDAFNRHGVKDWWLSEVASDKVALAWGDCKYEENKSLAGALHPDQSEEIRMIRKALMNFCLLYTSPSPRDRTRSRMPSSA